MKRWLPWILLGIFTLEAVMALRPRKDKDFHLNAFGRLPVLLDGRIQPIDSMARNALLQIRGNQAVPLEGNGGNGKVWGEWEKIQDQRPLQERKWWQFHKHPKKLKPTEWAAEVMTRHDQANQRYVFLIHHPELLGELKLEEKGIEHSGLKYFSFNELKPVLTTIRDQARQIHEAKKDPAVQTPFEKQVLKLFNAVTIYRRLQVCLQPTTSDDFSAELLAFKKKIEPGIAAWRAREAGQSFDKAAIDGLTELLGPYDEMANMGYALMIPPPHPEVKRNDWSTVGAGLIETIRHGEMPAPITYYAAMATGYRKADAGMFNKAVADYTQWLDKSFALELGKGRKEHYFNMFQPFYRAMLIYIFAFLLGCAYWFNLSEWLRKSAVWLIGLAWIIHTSGLIFRMVLEGRPPVTNLYSSAIFIGWGSVILGLILERVYQGGIGSVVASTTGFVTQIIAHNLALGGDTMQMLRAVLDTNFWLATHVVVVTLGYSATFVAGFLAIVYILRGVLSRSLTEDIARALSRMVYGITCFATLFSFTGTVLGGIWADQSWGRFWGWDPKENGALMIVLWCALMLHARWGGWVKDRGFMNLAIFGNIVTSFSWFGVNMLGIGLHSYGFMDAAFKWLSLFIGSQIVIMALGMVPLEHWMSFRDKLAKGGSSSRGGGKGGSPVNTHSPAPAKA